VDVRPEELGRRAAELIVSRLEGDSGSPDHFIVETTLIVRESSLTGGTQDL
jgi:DNA-binding LacI/PurR family transcriptional regulator